MGVLLFRQTRHIYYKSCGNLDRSIFRMPPSHASRLDSIYRSLLLTRFFTKGWGKPKHLKRIFELRRKLASQRTALQYIDQQPYPVTITKDEKHSTHRLLEG